MTFTAIDFETANYYRDSACAVGLVKVRNNRIFSKQEYLIRPPSSWFVFTDLHGIAWEDVQEEKLFGELWEDIHSFISDSEFLVAHNASFDEGVLRACCYRYDISPPNIPFECTMKLARSVWNIYPTKLPMVCEHFDIDLDHHSAISDAEACAQIMIRANKALKRK
jgi:DNA polymerase-3 subunit epsilon